MTLERARCGRYHAGLSLESFEASRAAADVKTALLGKEARYAPDRKFKTQHIRLELAVDFRRKSLTGLATIDLVAINELGALELDAAGMRIAEARFQRAGDANWTRCRHVHKDGKLEVRLPRLSPGGAGRLSVKYLVTNPKTGLHFVGKRQVWTQGQPEYSRYWFPCHDAPHEKTTSELIVSVPRGYIAVSNGVLAERKDAGARWIFHWRMNQPHSIYLISLAAGRFGVAQDRWRHVPVTYFCEKGREEDARRGLGKTPAALEYFSTAIGVEYPYEKYAQVIVGQYPGGMEHTTATTMTEVCLIDERAAQDNDVDLLMAHELAHQWFGDLLTCRDWSHAWLNEGFATYFELLFLLHDKGQDEFDFEINGNQDAYFHEDRDRYRRPIVCREFKDPWVLFDRHLYEKGGWVLHMLRAELGDELWWKAIRHYVEKHRNGSVETDDLIVAIEEATGRNMRWFFDQWVYKAGYPKLRLRYSWEPKQKRAELWVMQTQPTSTQTPAFKVNVDVEFSGPGWRKRFSRKLDAKEERWHFTLPGEPSCVELDPDHRLLKEVDFVKPLRLWTEQLRAAPRALSRAQAGREVARWANAEAVAALCAALARENFWAAAAEMATSIGSMRTPAAREALLRFVGHRHPKVRRAVLEGLAAFKNKADVRMFENALKRDTSLHARAEAARALGALGERAAGPSLERQLKEKSYRAIVAGGAIQGLAALRDRSRLPLLRRLARSGGEFERMYALRALGGLSGLSKDVVPWLLEHIQDPDERIGMIAVQALGRIGDERALVPLRKLAKSDAGRRLRVHAEESIARSEAGSEGKKRAPAGAA